MMSEKPENTSWIAFLRCRVHYPSAYYLCENGEPLTSPDDRYFVYAVYRSTLQGTPMIHRCVDGVTPENLIITEQEYAWALAHPEEIYTELLL